MSGRERRERGRCGRRDHGYTEINPVEPPVPEPSPEPTATASPSLTPTPSVTPTPTPSVTPTPTASPTVLPTPPPSVTPTPVAINVLDFGAHADGASDDVAHIQSAITAARGASVYFPAGNYRLASALVVPGGTKLVGAAWRGRGSRVRWSSAPPRRSPT